MDQQLSFANNFYLLKQIKYYAIKMSKKKQLRYAIH